MANNREKAQAAADEAKAAAKEKMAKAAKRKASVSTENLPEGVDGVEVSNEAKIQELLAELAAEKTQGGRKKIRARLRAAGYSLREAQAAAKAAGQPEPSDEEGEE